MADIFDKINNFMRSPTQKVVAGIWTSEDSLYDAARKAKAEGFDKLEAISPYPLHHIDEILGIPRSFIPWITFVFGMAGCIFGTWLTWWVHADTWPINIGGKPMFSFPAFVPIIFETTVLFAALSSVAVMFLRNGLPKIDPPIIDPDLTSHKFALFVPEDDKGFDEQKIKKLFNDLGAERVVTTEF